MKCEQCKKEFNRGYCWDCFQTLWIKWINDTYMAPKYRDIFNIITDLQDQQERLICEIREMMIKFSKLKTKK